MYALLFVVNNNPLSPSILSDTINLFCTLYKSFLLIETTLT